MPTGRTLVLIPAFNAANRLPELLRRLEAIMTPELDLLIVNDGSTDGTAAVLARAQVNQLDLDRNRGKGSALSRGFQYAIQCGYRTVITLDADLQHLPEEIGCFLALDDGRTILIGHRQICRRTMPATRRFSNYLTSMLISILSDRRIRDSQCGFRLIPVEVLRELRLQRIGFDFESELLFQATDLGYAVSEVAISTVYTGTRSSIRPIVDTMRFVTLVWSRIWN